MTETDASASPTAIHTRPRAIVRRTRGSHHGPITRLMSPGDLGQVLKPFVFLDLFDLNGASSGMGFHPHSGIATVSYLFDLTLRHRASRTEEIPNRSSGSHAPPRGDPHLA